VAAPGARAQIIVMANLITSKIFARLILCLFHSVNNGVNLFVGLIFMCDLPPRLIFSYTASPLLLRFEICVLLTLYSMTNSIKKTLN
jgi:hypothetical protein